MNDYSLNNNEKNDYIVDIHLNGDKTFDVIFLDGSRMNGILGTKENYSKVKEKMEEQAKNGVQHYSIFKKDQKKSVARAIAIASGIGACSISLCSAVPTLSQIASKNPPVTVLGIGAVTLLGTLPSIRRMRQSSKRLEELDKIKYRDQHKKELSSISNYPNSLNGVRSSLKRKIQHEEDAFSILNIRDYSIEDMDTIVTNIEREEKFQFTYKCQKIK